jgi:hypothetical protein
MIGAETPKGVVLVLAPIGRDAATVAGLIERTGLRAVMCNTVREVVDHLERIIEVVLVAEEALYGKNVLVLEDWVGRQPQWSDQPFVVLTNHNEGPKFAAFRRELVARLRNVGFLERPLQAITLQTTVVSAERARRRQYETRTALKHSAGSPLSSSGWWLKGRESLNGRTVNSGKRLPFASGLRQHCCRHRKSRPWVNLLAA